ncbi:MAG: dUTP diphosphatase [Planctomycetes bacterium]|nr:dUTP diphosphatase [Planctomycetota bacterium]MCD7896629.1 dUTP diphosphatase [Planctomycetaceae bacterium]
MNIRFALYDNDPAFAPAKAHDSDACYDLFARTYAAPEALSTETDDYTLQPGRRVLARTGVFVELPLGWEALVRPRSGNALKMGMTILNTPGTIDAGYRNEIGVILHNAGQEPLALVRGQKIAQIAFRPIPEHSVTQISMDEFRTDTDRGLGGFGSSGTGRAR